MPAVSPASSAPTAAASSTPAASRVSSSSAVISAARRNKLGGGLSAVLVLGVAAAAAYGVYAFVTRSRPTPFQNISVTKVTDGGKSVLAAISPDGNYILNLVRENGLASLWLRNVPTNSNTQVQPPADLYYLGLRFSTDGNYLYFERSEPGNTEEKTRPVFLCARPRALGFRHATTNLPSGERSKTPDIARSVTV